MEFPRSRSTYNWTATDTAIAWLDANEEFFVMVGHRPHPGTYIKTPFPVKNALRDATPGPCEMRDSYGSAPRPFSADLQHVFGTHGIYDGDGGLLAPIPDVQAEAPRGGHCCMVLGPGRRQPLMTPLPSRRGSGMKNQSSAAPNRARQAAS